VECIAANQFVYAALNFATGPTSQPAVRQALAYATDRQRYINVIDFDRLRVAAPHPVHNLPGGGRRLEQRAEGYRATVGGGVIVKPSSLKRCAIRSAMCFCCSGFGP